MTAVPARRMRRLLWASCALALAIPALLASCSGNENISYGTGVLTMSDLSGGFTGFSSYVINIDSITLTRNDGLIVEPLAEPETVDLVKLHDLSELVEAPAIPVGTYTSITLTLDYSAPFITVDENGVVTTASAVDPAGIALTAVALTVTFDPSNPLVITGGVCARIAIDLNLAASNTINYGTSPLTVTVQPFISATVAAADSTVMRAGGIFVVAQPSTSTYIVNMRPFADLVSALGALTVNVTDKTYFNINGTVYTGTAGLSAMAKMEVSTPVSAYGTLGDFSTITPTFDATAVYAGTTIESPLADYLTGTVTAVSGDTVSLHGDTYITRVGSAGYLADVPVTVSSATLVTEDGVAATGLTPQAISVGQVINVGGQGTADANGNLTMDATQGAIRLQPTPLWATLNSAAAGSMSLDVLSLGGFEPAAFNFTGTGTSAANDAAAADYLVNTGTLDESATPAGTLNETLGVVTPFGSAPPDFTAASVTLGSTTPQTLVVEWVSGGAASPFTSATSAGLVVNLANANLSATNRYITTGPQRVDITTLPASPTIVFASGVPLALAVGDDVGIAVFNSAASFATELATTLNGVNLVYRLVCVGQYSSTTNTFTATQVAVNLQTTT
jgi:Domain of unknown function (DUF4382)